MLKLKLLLSVIILFAIASTPLVTFAQNPELIQIEGVTSKLIIVQSPDGIDENILFEAYDESGGMETVTLIPTGGGNMAFAIVDSGSFGLVYGIESGALYGVVVVDIFEDALVRIDDDTEKKDHILKPKHCWGKVVETVSWESVRPIIKDVLTNGTESPYHTVYKKTLTLVDGDTVTVTYDYGPNGEILISDAWVNK